MNKIIDGKSYSLSSTTSDSPGSSVEHWVDVDGKELLVLRKDEREAPELGYRELRRAAYPSMGDQLDAILNTLNCAQMRKKLNATKDLDDIIGKWLNVKKKFPKG